MNFSKAAKAPSTENNEIAGFVPNPHKTLKETKIAELRANIPVPVATECFHVQQPLVPNEPAVDNSFGAVVEITTGAEFVFIKVTIAGDK